MPFPRLSQDELVLGEFVSGSDMFLTFGVLQDGKSCIHPSRDHWHYGT